jgi:hypothetical protein
VVEHYFVSDGVCTACPCFAQPTTSGRFPLCLGFVPEHSWHCASVQGLALGWIRFNFTAFANPLLWLSWILYFFEKYQGARICATLALVISAETLQLTVQPYLYDEGGSTEGFLVAPHIGFFCWIASMAVIWVESNRWVKIEETTNS